LAEAIEKEIGIKSKLVRSRGGVFEVEVDGKLIFSKKKEYRFPQNDEIINLLKEE